MQCKSNSKPRRLLKLTSLLTLFTSILCQDFSLPESKASQSSSKPNSTLHVAPFLLLRKSDSCAATVRWKPCVQRNAIGVRIGVENSGRQWMDRERLARERRYPAMDANMAAIVVPDHKWMKVYWRIYDAIQLRISPHCPERSYRISRERRRGGGVGINCCREPRTRTWWLCVLILHPK